MTSIKSQIFRELKSRNYRSSMDLAWSIDETVDVVEAWLDSLVMEGYLDVDDGLYFIKYVLGPAPPEPKLALPEYGSVIAELAMTGTDTKMPDEWMNPDIDDVVRRDQAGSPSCVGQAIAYSRDLDLIKLTGQRPERVDRDRVKRDVDYSDRIWYDIYYRQSMSAEHSYRSSREIGNVTYPAGSYVVAGMQALFERGICLHDQWVCPKSGIASWATPYPDWSDAVEETAIETAPKHKIDGYARVRTWNEVCQAIYKHGCVVGTIGMWENFMTQPHHPQLPNPRGDECGAHALCFIGYDSQRLYFLHSWYGYQDDGTPEWNKVGWISRAYFNRGFIDGYVALDDEECQVAYANHTTVTISCITWPDAVIWIDGVEIGCSPARIRLEIGKSYVIGISSETYGAFTRVKTRVLIPEALETTFICSPDVTPLMRIYAIIRKVYMSASRILKLAKV